MIIGIKPTAIPEEPVMIRVYGFFRGKFGLGTWAVTSVTSADGTKATMTPGCEVITISKERIRDVAMDPMEPTAPPDISDDAYDIVTKSRSRWSITLHTSETAQGVTTRKDVPMTLTTTGPTLIYEGAESRSVAVPYTEAMRATFRAMLDAIPKAKPGAPAPTLAPGPLGGVIGGKSWTRPMRSKTISTKQTGKPWTARSIRGQWSRSWRSALCLKSS